ncbi:MAG: hydrolase [Caldibacillus debilis]|nr:MAG: hydrolase [Caldibacillus debilis]
MVDDKRMGAKGMTEKLFYTDPKVFEWDAEVTGAAFHDGLWHVTLDKTAFYPEGGGQPCDLGTIAGKEVIHVMKKGEEVVHIIKEKPEGTRVHCQIDKVRRLVHTQHHSGQHLLAAVCLKMYRAKTLSIHLSMNSAAIELDVPALSDEQLENIEKEVNRLILEGRRIRIFYINRAEAGRYDLDEIPEGIERLRIVEIEGVEYNACGGTHVGSTSEIGPLKILKTERVRGHVRLHFICGIRLFEDYKEKLSLLADILEKLSTAQDTVLQKIEKIKKELKEKEQKYNALFDEYAELLTDRFIAEQKGPTAGKIFPDKTVKELSIISHKLLQKGMKAAVLGTILENKIILTQNGDLAIDCGKIIKQHAPAFSGKGGGTPVKAQAQFPDSEKLNEFFRFVTGHLGN